jgi:hypothetical protein
MDFTDIASSAIAAGFVQVQMGAQEPAAKSDGGR